MKNLIKYIIVMFRLARALKSSMPTDEIYKAKYIVPRTCEVSFYESRDEPNALLVTYRFALLDDYALNKIYKRHPEDYS